MFIHELSADECRKIMSEATLGRLGCARLGQPYVVPISFVCDGDYAYSVSMVGQKIEWMRENPLVAVEFDEIALPGVEVEVQPVSNRRARSSAV